MGVVGEIRARGPERESEPQVYIPYRQVSDNSIIWYAPKDLVLRISTPAAAIVPAVRGLSPLPILTCPSPTCACSAMSSMPKPIRAVQVRALAAFAVVAFLLAAIGIHGLLSFTVSSVPGNRHAPRAGAQRTDILGMILATPRASPPPASFSALPQPGSPAAACKPSSPG